MSRIDLNKLALMITVIIVVLIAAMTGANLEIGTSGLKFGTAPKPAAVQKI